MNEIRGENLSRTYPGDIRAVRDITLDIASGEICVIMGPSGSGKTTLLNLLALLDRPDAGRVLLDGEEVSGRDERSSAGIRSRRFGFVFQFFHLLPELTVLENVALPLWIRDRGRSDPRHRAEASRLLREFHLEHRENAPPTRLSGGELQRAAICRSIVSAPGVIFGDEPTGSIDAATARILFDVMLRLNRERGTTFIVATHNEKFLQIATKVVYLENGAVRKIEPRESPAPTTP